MMHYFTSSRGCPIHDQMGPMHDESARQCACSSYRSETASPKAWDEDHDHKECAAAGGACAHGERVVMRGPGDRPGDRWRS